MTSRYLRPCVLKEAGEEEGLCVLMTDSFPEMVVSHLVVEGEVLFDRVAVSEHCC